jgi:hypothetical protein
MLEAVAKIFRSQPSAKINAITRQVVDDSVADVAQLVANRMEGMMLSEARGYVRARSAQVVRRQTRLVLHRHPIASADWSASIIRSATERLVPLVLRQTGVGVPRVASSRAAA